MKKKDYIFDLAYRIKHVADWNNKQIENGHYKNLTNPYNNVSFLRKPCIFM